ncbi:MAG: ArgE/DapE family deacylase [Armatimonadetes bacterium]|nr:ArgE/DapE family deacylase [Armatimonadota bacterium]
MTLAGVEQRVLDAVGRGEARLLDDLRALVRIPSVVGQEGPCQAAVRRMLEDLGLTVHAFEPVLEEVRRHHAYVEVPWSYEGRPNVIGMLRGHGGGRSLILNGHVDVVSPEPVDAWSVDPWGAVERDGRIYGRGALDMKAGIAAILGAVRAIRDAGVSLRGDLHVHSVIEEEAGGGGGTLACFLKGYTADALIIAEPGGVAVAHAGVLYFRVRVTGKTAHAGQAHTGVNAIGKMHAIYDALIELDGRRAAEHRFELFERSVGRSCHLNIGAHRAGDWPSTVAGWAVMECRISFVPGERMEDVRREVEAVIAKAAAADPWLAEHPPVVEWFGWHGDPWVQDEGHPLVQTVRDAVESVTGQPAPVHGKAAGMDTRFAMYFGMPALSYGPGGERTHGLDEYVERESVIRCAKVLALSALRWCGVA